MTEVLDSVSELNLIDQVLVDRFQLHDLIRIFAAEHTPVPGAEERGVTYYVRQVRDRERAFYQWEFPDPGQWLRARDDALAWFDAERINVVSVTRHAAGTGRDKEAVSLAHHFFHYVDHYRLWPEWEETHEYGLAAARRCGDASEEARFLCGMGLMRSEQDRHPEAIAYQRKSLELARQSGNREQAGWACVHLGTQLSYERDHEAAGAALREGIALFRELGDMHGESWGFAGLGDLCVATADLEAAVDAYRESVQIRRRGGGEHGAVFMRTNLGIVYMRLGHYPEAAEELGEAIRLSAELHDSGEEARATALLGSVHAMRGEADAAGQLFVRARQLLDEIAVAENAALIMVRLAETQLNAKDGIGAAFFFHSALKTLGDNTPWTAGVRRRVSGGLADPLIEPLS
ncbi:tetratricopeptide repeat protein [Streptomyces sp. HUAS TT7]|uniref:tetratricopeptide repeat protein n=1 Tax=Streptomyces sp. HUAS TT7 TaxID=3447507 RepID=UPI003F65827C